ncbi:MAG: hypothetical protein GF313_07295 [Caldithrix sp.]|nr:hypothetical protein [Caldithrix sp.]
MDNRIILIFSIFFLALDLSVSRAQEIKIPFDENGNILTIDDRLERKLNLFPGYTQFKEAHLFQLSDSVFAVEIFCRPREQLIKYRLLYNRQEMQVLRQKVTQKIQLTQKGPALNQEGRTKMIGGIMTLSLAYYGWAFPAALEVDNGKMATALYMLTGGAGFFLPLSLTRDRAVSDAAATLSLYGGTRGIFHGVALANALSSNDNESGILVSGMLFSISETMVGYQIAQKTNMTAGTSEVIGVGGDFGMGIGLATAHLADWFDKNNEQTAAASFLVGSGLGMLGGNWLAGQQLYTRGDAHVLGATGLLGAYLPLAVVDLSNTDNDKLYTSASLLGSLVGLGLGHKLVAKKDFSKAQGNFIRLSEIAGGLLGTGFAYLLSSEGADNSSLYLTSSSIGATAGFWLMYRHYAGEAIVHNNTTTMHFNFDPGSILGIVFGSKWGIDKEQVFPLFSLSYRF